MSTTLIIFLILSIFIILKFSAIKLPTFLPKFIVRIFKNPKPDSNWFEIFKILEKLSLAFVTALIIFYLIDYIPKKRTEEKAVVISEQALTNIYMNMSSMIAPLKMIFEIDKENAKIRQEDLEKIKIYSDTLERKYYYNSDIYLSDKGYNKSNKGIFLYRNDLYQGAKKIKDLIDELSALPSSSNLPRELIETLSAIRSSDFLRICTDFGNPFTSASHEIYYYDSAFYEFIQHYQKLSAYKFRKIWYEYSKLGEDEILKLKTKKREVYESVKNQVQMNRSSYVFFMDGIQYRIQNGQLIE
ncbi:hypothetical protein [Flagellimonas marinaquae]|uniref:hypothetical protein n=1 Tax=Flagellimonas marinaquae TaxID=254955 RepID=UPI002075B337|nr:hypothetical protein [Allomuricauda aquimarina]USD25081.1 hypothetical protein MJO53_15495 [Allomuricauda aquimarina]